MELQLTGRLYQGGIKRGNRCSNDRPPSKEEIQNYWNIPIEE
jgi:translation elongation factor EF-G